VEGVPDPKVLHPVAAQGRVVFLRPLVTDPRIEVGD
jgi:virginiamycin A acetyltransferase